MNNSTIKKLNDFFMKNEISKPSYEEIQNIFYVGPNRYAALDNSGVYVDYDRQSIKTRVMRYAPEHLEKDERSAWGKEAMLRIETENVVDFSGPLACHQVGLHKMGPGMDRILVTRTNRPVLSGEGECPLILEILEQLFGPEDSIQYQTMYSSLSLFYQNMINVLYDNRDSSWIPGQAWVIVGKANSGKSFFTKLLTYLVGAQAAMPSDHMMNRTTFNDDLFASPLLLIDDEVGGDGKEMTQFLARLKQLIANNGHRRHAKHKTPITMPLRIRIVICTNNNATAMSIIPKLEDGISDKVNLFRVDQTNSKFDLSTPRERDEYWKALLEELPAFARRLLAHSIPSAIKCGRFGVKTWQHPELLQEVDNLNPESRILDYIDECFEEGYLKDTALKTKPTGVSSTAWYGKAHVIERHIRNLAPYHEQSSLFPFIASCGSALSNLSVKYPDRVQPGGKSGRIQKWIVWPSKQ